MGLAEPQLVSELVSLKRWLKIWAKKCMTRDVFTSEVNHAMSSFRDNMTIEICGEMKTTLVSLMQSIDNISTSLNQTRSTAGSAYAAANQAQANSALCQQEF